MNSKDLIVIKDRECKTILSGHAPCMNTLIIKSRRKKFENAYFYHQSFWSVKFQNFNLKRADLRGSSFWQANLERARLNGANIQGTRFRFANLKKADLRGVIFDDRTTFYGANLEGALMDDDLKIHIFNCNILNKF